MKIACLSLVEIFPDYVLGGSQNILRKIIIGLRNNGIRVRLFSPINDQPKSFINDVEIENILNLRGSFPSPFEIPLYELQNLSNTIDEIKTWADRIYLHGDGWFMREEFFGSNIISGIHDLVYQESLTSVIFSKSNKIIVPSNYLKQTIKASLSKERFRSKNISVIKNSIDNFSKEKHTEKHPDKDTLVLLFPHRPDLRKGINNALRISLGFAQTKRWKKVILSVPKFNKLLNKDEKNSSNLHLDSLEKFNRNGGEINFHDWIPINEMSQYYKSGDLTLCPGNFIESFGLVPLESLANGTPVICSAVGAFREFSNFEGIRIIPYGDIEGFVNKGIELLEEINEIKYGSERVINNYNLDNMITEYIETFTNPNSKLKEEINDSPMKVDTVDGKYFMSPWCFISNNKIYHDYKGWMKDFENKFKLQNKRIILDHKYIEKAISEKILISY